MKDFVNLLVLAVSILHFWFLLLEMVFWQKPIGLKTFRNSPQKAKETAVLAANQGLYNGFLAVGLMISLFVSSPDIAFAFRTYFLTCVVVAGIYGAWTVSRRIFFVQALPALMGLILSANL